LKNAEIKDLGLVDYDEAWKLMAKSIFDRPDEGPDEIWFLEHNPIYTLGQAAFEGNIISENDIPIMRTDRGGEVTYHGPGQLIIYFLLNLRRLKWGPKKLIFEIESLLIDLLSRYDIQGERVPGAPGIYVNHKKIASIGLKIKKGFCYHGISLNIDMDLKPFDNIITCCIESLEVIQIKDLTEITMAQVKIDLMDLLKTNQTQAA
jgi:lipoyl(octanoyl) transferase